MALLFSSLSLKVVAVIGTLIPLLLSVVVVEGGASSSDSSGIIVLEDFTSQQQHHGWEEMNDPVMGGKSTGTFQIKNGQFGQFVGKVAIVPFLHAPGFIKVESSQQEQQRPSSSTRTTWPDISSCDGLQLTIKAHTQYTGYRVSFGKNRPPHAFPYIYGYKANFDLHKSRDFVDVQIPFDDFSNNWDPATGDAIVSCYEDNQYCPDEETKKDLYSIAIWGEGVKGNIHLDIKMISAYGCDDSTDEEEEEEPSSTTDDGDDNDDGDDDEIIIEDFSSHINSWITLNDPVMGGRSTSSLTIQDGIASFTGRCAIVPFLDAPGFITMVTGRIGQKHAIFPDVSTCRALKITLRSMTDYDGYYVSFGTDRVPGGHHAMGYKTPLVNVPYGDEFDDIILPFSTFSSKWDDATGKTQVKCSEDPKYCPTIETLQDMKTMSFWGEGVEGDIALDIKSISAVGCSTGIDPEYESLLRPSPQEAASISTALLNHHGGGSSAPAKFDFASAAPSNCFILLMAFAFFGLLLMLSRTVHFNSKRSMYEELRLDATSSTDLA